jgi:hypothetical protein
MQHCGKAKEEGRPMHFFFEEAAERVRQKAEMWYVGPVCNKKGFLHQHQQHHQSAAMLLSAINQLL